MAKTSENAEQRHKFLVDHGFTPYKRCRGLISPPTIWKDSIGQTITLCENPANRRWQAIKKYVKKAADMRQNSAHERAAIKARQASQARREFNIRTKRTQHAIKNIWKQSGYDRDIFNKMLKDAGLDQPRKFVQSQIKTNHRSL